MSSANGHFPAKRETKATTTPVVPTTPTTPGTVTPMAGGGPGAPKQSPK